MKEVRGVLVLAVAVLTVAFVRPHLPGGARTSVGRAELPAPSIERDEHGRIMIHGEGDVHYTLDGSVPDANSSRYVDPFMPNVDRSAEALVHTPTSVQWRHPVGAFPAGLSVRACAVEASGRRGAIATRAFVPGSSLPVLALTLPPGAFFDPDSGIYVVGHAIFHTEADFVQRYPRDQKWWKYPGNFHFRTKRAQRTADLALFDPAGRELAEVSAGVRINGNNTRGFPQHALRIAFDEPFRYPVFGAAGGEGWRGWVVRASGNDQDRAFLRDALQHRLCAELPFETSAYTPAVLYVDGAYWGIHDIRERMDAAEIARRHGLKKKQVTILADRLVLYEGRDEELAVFTRLLERSERWDASGHAFVDSLDRYMDVESFLSYMAAQVVLANTDWPDQNVKWWRYTGTPDTVRGPRDGRWRWIMGDSDLGFGLVTTPSFDMFQHLERHPAAPTTRLWKACLRSPILRERWRTTVEGLLAGPLSAERMVATAEAMRDAVQPEMDRHIRRWRRPLTTATWERHIATLLTFAAERGTHVRTQLQRYARP